MKPLSRGELAKLTEVGIETLRFYEREGLLGEPPRSESGHRRYPETAIGRVRFIKRAKALGFSLREVSELLALRVDAARTCGDVKARAQEKIEEIDKKLQDLKNVKDALERLASLCTGRGPSSECPILEALESLPQRERSSSATGGGSPSEVVGEKSE